MDLDAHALYRSTFPEDKKFPYTKERTAQITRHRNLLNGDLFFDLVLTDIAQIEHGMISPPPPGGPFVPLF
jgi:hypothetical protein